MEQFQLSFFCVLITILLSSLITLLIFCSRAYNNTTTSKKIPGLWRLPIIGNIHYFIGHRAPHHRLHDLVLRHGPQLMLLRLGQVDYVVVSSRDAVEDVFKTHDLNFSERPRLVTLEKRTYGYTNMLFAPYGSYWRQLRKICVMELLTAKRVKSFGRLRREEISNLVNGISASAGTPVNLSRRLRSLSNGIVFRAVMGKRCADEDRFIELMKEGLELLTGTTFTDLFPSMGFVDVVSGKTAKLERMRRPFHDIMNKIVDEHERALVAKRGKEEDILDVMLKLKDSGELDIPLTKQHIKAVAEDLFIAGTDTTATTLGWAMAEMMRNPRVMNRAQTETRQALLGKTNLEETDVANLTYLKLVIKETLRLHPSAPFFPRECRESCQVQGYTIPKGRRILVNVWGLGRDPNYWEDPDHFNPERFEDSPIDFKGTDFNFLPFGGGRRMCPGITFAMATMEFALAHLLFYFDWQLPDGMKRDELDMTEYFSGTLSKKEDLHLVASTYAPLPVG